MRAASRAVRAGAASRGRQAPPGGDIGDVAALRFERAMLGAAVAPAWPRPALAAAPRGDAGPQRRRAGGCGRAACAIGPQGAGDLGVRMRRALAACPPGPAVLVGADIPALGAAHIAEAFRLLGRHDLVFGPAEDGGFWLVGARRSPRLPPLFGAGALVRAARARRCARQPAAPGLGRLCRPARRCRRCGGAAPPRPAPRILTDRRADRSAVGTLAAPDRSC